MFMYTILNLLPMTLTLHNMHVAAIVTLISYSLLIVSEKFCVCINKLP